MKKIAFLLYNIPDISFGGGNRLVDNLIRILLDNKVHNYEVILISLKRIGEENIKSVEKYKELGIKEIFSLDYTEPEKIGKFQIIKRLFKGMKIDDIFPSSVCHEKLDKIVKKEHIDVLMGFHFEVLAPIAKVESNVKKIGIVGDPDFDVQKQRIYFLEKYGVKSLSTLKNILTRERMIKYMKKYIPEIIMQLDRCGEVSYEHAEELSSMVGKEVKYFHLPCQRGELQLIHKPLNKKPVIMMCGHMRAISTAVGIEFLAFDILPEMRKRLGKDGFELRLLGRYFETLPMVIQGEIKKYSEVKILGFVDSIEEEYQKADLLLVSTPIRLGIRTRIVNAFAEGICVVAHSASSSGIKELVDNENCLMGDCGEVIVDKIIEVTRNQQMIDRIRENAYQTFYKYFEINQSSKIINVWVQEMLEQCNAEI